MSFALLGRMIAQKVGAAPEKPDYPLWQRKAGDLERAHLGGVINTEGMAASFVLAGTAGTLIEPMESAGTVVGYGKIEDGDFILHRFYMAEHMVQVITGLDGLVCAGEMKLFQKLAEINPSTPEEWELWTESVGGGQPLLTSPTLLWQNSFEFTRVWSPGNGPAEPKRYVETLSDGVAGQSPTVINVSAMLFSRRLSTGITEWLQLAMCRESSERWIEAYVGLSFEPGEVTAI
jgi:hypothetical protein